MSNISREYAEELLIKTLKDIKEVSYYYTNDKDYQIFDNEDDNLDHVFELIKEIKYEK